MCRNKFLTANVLGSWLVKNVFFIHFILFSHWVHFISFFWLRLQHPFYFIFHIFIHLEGLFGFNLQLHSWSSLCVAKDFTCWIKKCRLQFPFKYWSPQKIYRFECFWTSSHSFAKIFGRKSFWLVPAFYKFFYCFNIVA